MPLLLNLLAKNSGSWPNSWVAVWLHMMSRCFGWGPRHTWNGSQFYKVFGNIHMLFLWMGRWIHHHVTSIILVCEWLSLLADFLGHRGAAKLCQGWLVEAPTPHCMLLTSTWCCGWTNGSTIMPLPSSLLVYNFHSWQISWIAARCEATNAVKVDQLWPKTHMERFHFSIIISCGWGYGSTLTL